MFFDLILEDTMLSLYNSATHQKQEFIPIRNNEVRFYGCGPTVYNYAHIGNIRAFVFYDLMNRYLRYKGFKVTFAMNLTDVDDKTIRNSRAEGISLRAFTDFYAEAFFKDMEALHIKKPDYIIRATEEIDAMIELINLLLEKGYAYKSKTGDIFFKIKAFKEYGQMAGIQSSQLRANADGRLSDEYEKEDVNDFALWKAYTEKDGDVFWDAPFGRGRPGWSLECSAMARKYLGQPLDMHLGGVDLIFPHHTNEIAQSECAYGCKFVNYWIHNAHIMVNGKKMSKSANNFYTLRDLTDKGYSPEAVRYELLKAHYRVTMDFKEENLSGNQTVIERFVNLIHRLDEPKEGQGWPSCDEALECVANGFEKALDDDLNMPMALAAFFDFISEVNKNFNDLTIEQADKIKQQLLKFDTVLALLPKQKEQKLTVEQEELIQKREAYRAVKDWANADAVKKQLADMGIIVKDTPKGPIWTIG